MKTMADVLKSPGLGNALLKPSNILLIAVVVFIHYIVFYAFYNVYIHPLRSFPGPWIMRASRLPFSISLLRGKQSFLVLDLHRKYGNVVRVAPDELVFADARAWKDIMGHRGAGEDEFGKPEAIYHSFKDQPPTLIAAQREEHGKIRRQLAHGFSERSLREQQPIIKQFVDLLIQRLHENCGGGSKTVDMVKWYNYTTFDIIGDLTFGESFGCLQTSEYHPWVAMIFSTIKAGAWAQTASFFPWIKAAIFASIPKGVIEERLEHIKLTRATLQKRVALGAERPDLIEGLLRNKDETGMDFEKLLANASIIIVAGSETTATLLSGITYHLGMNPDILAKLTEEVRTAFKTEDEINYLSVSNLEYMLACLDEALRVYPPAPLGIPRECPPGGGNVAGYYVPEKTIVSVYHYAVYHYEKFFTAPDEYHPERWLGDPRFANDEREVFQPFQVGPRNCIGRNLAYIEMRLILARLLWNFDLKLADESKNWQGSQKIFILWEKPPLNVYLTPRIKE